LNLARTFGSTEPMSRLLRQRIPQVFSALRRRLCNGPHFRFFIAAETMAKWGLHKKEGKKL
jgi:hypothetical protein